MDTLMVKKQKENKMITLQEGLKLAIKANACKGNLESFNRALAEGNELECYQVALGNHEWLIEMDIIEESDLPGLGELAQGIGKAYHDNDQLMLRFNIKNGELNGLYENWYENGQLSARDNYKNDKLHGTSESWYENGQLHYRVNYENGEIK